MNELHLFAGAGGGILGGMLLGHTTVCAVELEEYPRKVLLQRQRDGVLPWFPVWDDVCTFDGKPWSGKVDVVCGGFPCQDISIAGKGAGITGERSGLWGQMARIIGEVRPRYAFVENSPMLVQRGLSTVLSDLAEIGYDAVWTIMGADDVGAPHRRKRIWILAYSDKERVPRQMPGISTSKTMEQNRERQTRGWFSKDDIIGSIKAWVDGRPSGSIESPLRRTNDGMADCVDRLKAIGNGQVPIVAATAFNYLMGLI